MSFRDEGKLDFRYERPMQLKALSYPIKTDFWVKVGDRDYYWEHLGMLEMRDYSENWKARRQGYEADGLGDNLLTTDDLSGLSQDLIQKVVGDMVAGQLGGAADARFSAHHYRLYPQ